MAGHKIIRTDINSTGYPLVKIIENGNIEEGDEWAFFRMTEEGASFYHEIGCEMAVKIMTLKINEVPAVEGEVARFKTREKAKEVWDKLTKDERYRTLVRSVLPQPASA